MEKFLIGLDRLGVVIPRERAPPSKFVKTSNLVYLRRISDRGNYGLFIEILRGR